MRITAEAEARKFENQLNKFMQENHIKLPLRIRILRHAYQQTMHIYKKEARKNYPLVLTYNSMHQRRLSYPVNSINLGTFLNEEFTQFSISSAGSSMQGRAAKLTRQTLKVQMSSKISVLDLQCIKNQRCISICSNNGQHISRKHSKRTSIIGDYF